MIIGIAIPSCIAVLGGILTYGYINDVKNRQDYVQVADDLKESVFEVRRTERNFLHYKDNEHHKILDGALADLERSVQNIPPKTAEQIGAGGFSLLNGACKKYSRLIDDLYSNYQKEQDAIKLVKDEGENLESVGRNKNNAQELTSSFILKLRLLEKNYIFYRDKKSFFDFNNGLIQIKNFTPFCFACEPYVNTVHSLFAVYRETESLVNTLQLTGNEMEEISGRIAFRERQKIDSFIDRSRNLLLVALGLLCILGPLFVYKTSSFIVTPINRLSEIAKKISGGDISLRAPIKEHDETYLLAVSFNTMLDHLQETQQSLKESVELLNEKQAQLVESEKRASLGFLVAGVAHELNNPLNNISLTAETMNADLDNHTPEEMSELINDILMQSKRAHTTVENLLDFARARKSVDMEKQDITSVVNDSISLVANQLRISEIQLVKNVPEQPIYVNGNRSKLEQVLISIMTNAMQSMKEPGTLSIRVEPDNNGFVFIKISDTGHGIPEDDVKNIFEPFYTTKPLGEGTGLGLSISNTLIAEHKGEIIAESKMGKGSTFSIKLPLCKIS
jgi:signal transduction histidine kinase